MFCFSANESEHHSNKKNAKHSKDIAAFAVYETSFDTLRDTVPLDFVSVFIAFDIETCVPPQCVVNYLVS